MYVTRLLLTNVKAIESFNFTLKPTELTGWHVILGANGAGKSSIVKSLALALAGPREAHALRQNWGDWLKFGSESGKIHLGYTAGDRDIFTGKGRQNAKLEATLEFQPVHNAIGGPKVQFDVTAGSTSADRSIWGTNTGWFSASFGPFRRFSGGDQAFDRLYYSNPRLASHLSAFGEDVALTEGLRWLRELHVKKLENMQFEGMLLDKLIEFLNISGLMPHGARVVGVTSDEVKIVDANNVSLNVELMSDGYRSILSMIFEILRQMTKAYGIGDVLKELNVSQGTIGLPGVVAIDEVDAHLHPSWQNEIGSWFTKCFPQVQFIVTTHSPIICRNASSVWRLAAPGTEEVSGRLDGIELNRLVYGSILDAYGTELFGRDIARSDESKQMLKEMALLNRRALRGRLSSEEVERMDDLRATFPTLATELISES